MPQPKTEFRNATDRTIGVVTIEPGGREVALPLVPGASIWLTEDEEIATANAPARDEDNPFANGSLEPVGKPENLRNRRPIGSAKPADERQAEDEALQREAARAEAERRRQEQANATAGEEARLKAGREEAQRGGARPAAQRRQSPEETGAPPQPQGKAAEGSRAAGEEVGTPEAASAS